LAFISLDLFFSSWITEFTAGLAVILLALGSKKT
jgi:hypothetical protein